MLLPGLCLHEEVVLFTGMASSAVAAQAAKRKWDLERAVVPHRLYRWYWEAIAWIVAAVAYVVGIVFAVQE
jgi:hypothetical protein